MIQKEISADEQGKILDFADYILQYIQFIVIETNCNANKVFSMFESINSKGKRLEEIDLISTGSACDSVNTQISHVLQTIGVAEEQAKSTIRVSFSKDNTIEEAVELAETLNKIVSM